MLDHQTGYGSARLHFNLKCGGTWRKLLHGLREGRGCGNGLLQLLEGATGRRHSPHTPHPVRHRVLVKHTPLLQLSHVHLGKGKQK